MGDFFEPWRRKLGVVTLLTTCLIMGAWLRSDTWQDSLTIRLDERTEHRIVSSPLGVSWMKEHIIGMTFVTLRGEKSWPRFECIQLSPPDRQFRPYYKRVGYKTCQVFDKSGFIFGRTLLDELFFDIDSTFWVVPYWSIAIPLTLLSAYLLFSKTRTAKLTTIVENRILE